MKESSRLPLIGLVVLLPFFALSLYSNITAQQPRFAELVLPEVLQGECTSIRTVRAFTVSGRPGVAVFLKGRWQVDSSRTVEYLEVRGTQAIRETIRVHTGFDFEDAFIRSIFIDDVAKISPRGPSSLFFNNSFTEVLVVLDERIAEEKFVRD